MRRVHRVEERRLPDTWITATSWACATKRSKSSAQFRPATIGQAARIGGITPADIAVLLVALERRQAPTARSA